MTAELGTILGLSIPVVLSGVGVAWRMGRVEGRLSRADRSVKRLRADRDWLLDSIGRFRDHLRTNLWPLPARTGAR